MKTKATLPITTKERSSSKIHQTQIIKAKENNSSVVTSQSKNCLENAFCEFKAMHTNDIESAKYLLKRKSEDLQKCLNTELKNKVLLQTTKNKLIAAVKEIQQCKQEQQMAIFENNNCKQEILTLKQKLTQLEVTYDGNISAARKQEECLKQEVKMLQLAKVKVAEELATSRQDLLDKLKAATEQQFNLTEELQQARNSCVNKDGQILQLRKDFEAYKVKYKSAEEKACYIAAAKYKQELEALTAELAKKDELIEQIRSEKNEKEQKQNKVIDELTFKVREIERVFGQPYNRVQPQRQEENPAAISTIQPAVRQSSVTMAPTGGPSFSLRTNNNNQQPQQSLQSNQAPQTSQHCRQSRQIQQPTQLTQQSRQSRQIQQPAQLTQQSLQSRQIHQPAQLAQQSHQSQQPLQPQQSLPLQRFLSENPFTSDDDDDDNNSLMLGWKPYNNSARSSTIAQSDCGFKTNKRSSTDETIVESPETPESERRTGFKRTKL